MIYNTHTLPNGLRIIHCPTNSQVAYCGFAINTGTRDEEDEKLGMAHFVEHLIFKGTEKRKAWHILNRLENVGGELNAFTNKEETVVYAIVLKEHFTRALELLADIVFHSRFPAHEIEREVDVIIDEIHSYKDSPSELIFDEFEEMIFQNHPLGRNILGTPEQLRTFTTADALKFTTSFYQPNNMVFFVQVDCDFKKVIAQVEKMVLVQSNSLTNKQRTAPTLYLPTHQRELRNTHQAHVIIGNRAFDAFDERRMGLYLLNNILGGPGMNSRLNLSLRERKGLVYSVESSISSYTDAGIFTIYFGTASGDVDRCVAMVYKELKRLRENQLTHSQLNAAKKQLIGQLGISIDNNESNALGMAKSYLHYHRVETQESLFARIEALNTLDLLTIANEVMDEKSLSSLIYL